MIDVSIDGLVSYTRIISFTLIDFSNNQFFGEILDLWRGLNLLILKCGIITLFHCNGSLDIIFLIIFLLVY